MTRCKPREWHQRQERRALAAPRSCTKCARSVCHGHCLRHCSRAARRCRSISRAHPMRAHMCVAAGRWQCTAAHRLWRLECPRQQCWSLTCVLGPQQTAAVATAAACYCLIQSSQRCSEACRIRAVWYLLRLSAFRPGDRSWMVRWSSLSSIEPFMAGRWWVERDVVSGEMYRKTKKTRI